MPSTMKSNRRKGNKFNFVPKPKQQWQVKQAKKDWLDLPYDVTANILYRVGVFDILENAQKVCTAWRRICKDPSMWRVIRMEKFSDPNGRPPLREMCKHVVDRSQGQLVEISMVDFANDELLLYIAHRSSRLKRLKLVYCSCDIYYSWSESFEKFAMLEELSIYITYISKQTIEIFGQCCPKLKTLKVNLEADRWLEIYTDEECIRYQNEVAIAVGENLRGLRHLELIGNSMTDIGLKAILDNCIHLESLDLRQCFYIDLNGDLGRRCRDQIKCLKLPNDSLEDCPYIRGQVMDVYDDSEYDYDDYAAYDNAAYDNEFNFFDEEGNGPNFENANDWMMFMAMFE